MDTAVEGGRLVPCRAGAAAVLRAGVDDGRLSATRATPCPELFRRRHTPPRRNAHAFRRAVPVARTLVADTPTGTTARRTQYRSSQLSVISCQLSTPNSQHPTPSTRYPFAPRRSSCRGLFLGVGGTVLHHASGLSRSGGDQD